MISGFFWRPYITSIYKNSNLFGQRMFLGLYDLSQCCFSKGKKKRQNLKRIYNVYSLL